MKIFLTLSTFICLGGISFAQVDKIDSLVTASGFRGTVFLSKGSDKILAKGYGNSCDDAGIMNNEKTVYEIGSTSKQFTTFAIIDLVVHARISVSDPLSKFFPDVPADKAAITLHQLMIHSSGLETYHDKQGALENMDRQTALKRIFSQKLQFAPGTQYEYSNSGYTLLALVIEKVTGKPFDDYLKELLFKEAGIKISFYGYPGWARDSVACGYGIRERKINHPYDRGKISWAVLGAGAMMMNLSDYHQWMIHLTGSPNLEKHRKLLFGEYIKYTQIKDDANYGYAWVTLHSTGPEGTVIYHNGGDTDLGYITTVRYYPAKKILLLMCANHYNDKDILFGLRKEIISQF